jgi:hypothetical protein
VGKLQPHLAGFQLRLICGWRELLGLPRVGRRVLCAAAWPVMLAGVASCSSSQSFQGQIPNYGNLVTNVSSAQAFRDHGIKVPGNLHGLRYIADSQSDGYPMAAYFSMPCQEEQGFVASNTLSEDSSSLGLPDQGVVGFAQNQGWKSNGDSTRWYQRPKGGAIGLEVMVSYVGSTCTVYLETGND